MWQQRIGQKIKELRKARGLSQGKLAERIDVSYQQVQKYENGTTQIPIQRLFEIAKVLEVPINVFLDELAELGPAGGGPLPPLPEEPRLELTREEEMLLKAFREIEDKKIRRRLLRQFKGIIELLAGKASS